MNYSKPTAEQTKELNQGGKIRGSPVNEMFALLTSDLFDAEKKNCETKKGHTQGGTGRSLSQYSLPARGGA